MITEVPAVLYMFFWGGGAQIAPPPESGFAPPEMGYDQFNTGQSPYKARPPQFRKSPLKISCCM